MANAKGKMITVYASKRCGTCERAVPVIRSLAKKKGFRVKVVDLDKCKTQECNDVRFTPTIKVEGKEVSPKELSEMLK